VTGVHDRGAEGERRGHLAADRRIRADVRDLHVDRLLSAGSARWLPSEGVLRSVAWSPPSGRAG
jgi:hypothetical protein